MAGWPMAANATQSVDGLHSTPPYGGHPREWIFVSGCECRFPPYLIETLLTYWNGYPLVFSGLPVLYLAQAIEHYAGWDRPIFYSLFLLPLRT